MSKCLSLVRLSAAVLTLLGLLAACAVEPDGEEEISTVQLPVAAPLPGAYCSVVVQGKGARDMEKDYLPHVIQCENGGAGLQALKAQAIAARSVAYYNMATQGSICDSQGCQVYSCGATPQPIHYQAVKETAGMYLSYAGMLTYGFYVAGGSASPPSCHGGAASTEKYVTYNSGKTGGAVTQTSLGYKGPPGFGQNRGCMSQLGARCLESKGYNYKQILSFYYGADIGISHASGSCTQQTCKAQCAWDGNLIQKDCSVVKCTSVGASCVDDSKGLRCASVFCVDQGKTSAKDICLPDGRQASCGSKGALKNISKCPSGQTCVPSGSTTRCGLSCSKKPVAGAEQEVFKDMAPDTFGHPEALALHDAGVVSGCQASPKLFCGDCELSRQALAKMVVLAAELPLVNPKKPTFSDFAPSAGLYEYVETAAAAGLMTGYPNGEFRPNDPVTRGGAAVVLARAAKLEAPSPKPESFTDVAADSWWSDGIEALYANCVAKGYGDGKFRPDKLLTRRGAAVLVARAFGMVETPCGGFVGGTDPSVDPSKVPETKDSEPKDPEVGGDPAVSRGAALADADDGGCSIGGTRSRSSSLWALVALTLCALRRRKLGGWQTLRNARAFKTAAVAVISLGLFGCSAEAPLGQEAEPESVAEVSESLSSINCAKSQDTGYTKGSPFPITVVTVDGKKVERDTANAYYVMAQAAAKAGVNLKINSGFRTMAEQQKLYSCYVNCNCNNCNLAAKPGYSNHQSGHALDLNTSAPGVLSWLNAHAGSFGFKRTVPSENWHWEWWGGGPGGGPCVDTCKAQCAWDGNLIQKDCSVVKCTSVGASCVDDSKGLRCASVLCVDQGKTSAKDICLPDGRQASCGSKGALKNISKCPSGQTCVPSGSTTRCGLSCSKKPVAGAEQEVFKDMAPDTFGHPEALALHDAGVVSGCQASPKLFCGDCELSRQALAKMVVLAAELPLVNPKKPTFSDFAPSAGLYEYVETAAAAGLMTGYPNGEFRPNDPVTRGGAAVVLARAAKLEAPSPKPESFTDVAADSWWSDGIEALYANCVAKGYGDGKFRPDKLLTRRGAAVFVARAFGLVETPCGGFVGGTDPSIDPSKDPEAKDPETKDPEVGDDPAVSRGAALADADDSGCTVGRTGRESSGAWLGLLLLGVTLWGRRRWTGSKHSPRRLALGAGTALGAVITISGCSAAEVQGVEARRATLSGDSPLIAHFRDAEARSGVPAELLATVAYAQSRFTQGGGDTDGHAHGAPEIGVMAIGTAGSTQLMDAARLSGLSEASIQKDARANIIAAGAWLQARGATSGLGGVDAWWDAVAKYGGSELVEEVRLLMSRGFEGVDDAGLAVRVAPLPPSPELGDGIAQVSEPLGYPGATFTPAASSNYSKASRGAGQINYIVIHTIQGSYSGAISWFKNPAAKVSSHYVVRSSDGRITQMVDDSDIAYHDACFNSNSIGIEHEGYVDNPGKWYTDAMYRESAKLTAWLCDKYNIPKDRQHILGHNETPDCSSHTDPGPGWDWNKYMKYVKGEQTCKAQCAWDGNLIQKDCSVVKCTSVGASCVDDSKGLRCASVFCVDKGKTSAKDICLPDGSQASCSSKGDLKNISKCPSGQTCVSSGGTTRCGLACSKKPVAGAEQEVFKDMAPDTWGHPEALALYDAGVVSGCQASPKLFCGDCELSRQALAKMAVLGAGLPLVNPKTPTFSDFAPSAGLYQYVETAAAAGLMTGYPNGEFRPNNPVTRGSAAVVLARAAKLEPPSPKPESFTDVSPDSWWSDGIEALYANCVAKGYGDGQFRPDRLLTRRGAVVLVARAFGLVETPCGGFVGGTDLTVDPKDPQTEYPQVPGVSRGAAFADADDGACSVSAIPSSPETHAWWGLLIAVGLVVRRRRSRSPGAVGPLTSRWVRDAVPKREQTRDPIQA